MSQTFLMSDRSWDTASPLCKDTARRRQQPYQGNPAKTFGKLHKSFMQTSDISVGWQLTH